MTWQSKVVVALMGVLARWGALAVDRPAGAAAPVCPCWSAETLADDLPATCVYSVDAVTFRGFTRACAGPVPTNPVEAVVTLRAPDGVLRCGRVHGEGPVLLTHDQAAACLAELLQAVHEAECQVLAPPSCPSD